MNRNKFGTVLRSAAAVGALSVALAACSSGSGSDEKSAAPSAAPTSGSITVWAWEPTLKAVVASFEKENPDIHVNLVNAGTSNDEYTALQNAIKAGKGVPDVAQIEYGALPQFAYGKSLTDLTQYGADKLDGTFTPGPWTSVKQGDAIYGLPMDSGPMALFYNKKVFDEHGLTVPTTWDEYLADAKKLHEADPKAYITSDTGDAGLTMSMIWQAGGHPFQVDGTNVKINLADDGSNKFATYWQQLIDQKLIAPISGWSDEWYKGLGDGTIATLLTGAWMPANLESGVPGGKGDWRVAPMPQWSAGDKANSENGGSSLAIPTAAGKNAALADKFIDYATSGPGVKIRVDGGAFPATTADVNSPDFTGKELPYFGGQKVNEVLSQAAADVLTGWQYLPFQVYANSVFADSAGKAWVTSTPLTEGLKGWQDALVDYGNQQGFSVNK